MNSPSGSGYVVMMPHGSLFPEIFKDTEAAQRFINDIAEDNLRDFIETGRF